MIEFTSYQMCRLLILVSIVRTPDFNDLTLTIVPEIIESQLLSEPVKPLTCPTDERKYLLLGVA
jgi:hypothetical protein